MDKQQTDLAFKIAALLRRRVQGNELSPEEQEILDNWIGDNPARRLIPTELGTAEDLAKEIIQYHYLTDPETQLEKFNRRLKKSTRIVQLRRWLAIASAVLLVGFGLWFAEQHKDLKPEASPLISRYGGDALPGANRATLQLSDQKIVTLDTHEAGIVVNEHGISYRYGRTLEKGDGRAEWVTLRTPNGGYYKVLLADGTAVYLNAGSSLRYPTRFDGTERKVALQGEAYFDVQRLDGKPFIVATPKQQIVVLGTQFNVKAYAAKERTSLVKGKVAVTAYDHHMLLMPGQQALIGENELQKKTVDIEEAIAWTTGRIACSQMGLVELSADIERWYDVKFVFGPHFSNTEKAFININRGENLSVVLQALEQIYKVKFKIDRKEVLVF